MSSACWEEVWGGKGKVSGETRVLILGKNDSISYLLGRILVRADLYEPIRGI
jgi:hypothetical protein